MQELEVKTNSAVLIESIDGKALLKEIKSLREELNALSGKFEPTNQAKYINCKELCKLAGITEPTRWKYTKQGIFKAYHIGNTVRYLESEVLTAISSMTKRGGVK